LVDLAWTEHMPTTAPISTTPYLSAMSATVTGVNIVTTDGPAGRFGLTVSSMASVSAEPPLLLVSLNRRSPLLGALLENGVFGVSALGVHHADLADTFAGRPRAGTPYDFAAAHWLCGPSRVPLVADAAARFDCRVISVTDAGTHAIVVGAVEGASRGAVAALAYTRRDYARPAPWSTERSGEGLERRLSSASCW
jgi:flavin reductase